MKIYSFATLFTLCFLLLISLTSCKKEKNEQPINFGTERYDSAALHVALVPNRDCLPIYYAERTGIYDSLGLKLQIASYGSQMDCDTTLMGNIADGGWCDKIRKGKYGKRMSHLETMWEGTQRWEIFTSKALRIRKVSSLVGHTIGIARSSAENEYLHLILKAEKVNADNIYYPQINNLKMRAQMLTGDQIDAAVITWPYTSFARSEGHHCIAAQRFADKHECFVISNKHLTDERKKQWKLFEKGRRMALDSIRIKGSSAYSIILQKDYGLPKEVADTIRF